MFDVITSASKDTNLVSALPFLCRNDGMHIENDTSVPQGLIAAVTLSEFPVHPLHPIHFAMLPVFVQGNVVSIVAPYGSSGASLRQSVSLFLVQYVMHLVHVAMAPPTHCFALCIISRPLITCSIELVVPCCWSRAFLCAAVVKVCLCVCSVVVVKLSPQGA